MPLLYSYISPSTDPEKLWAIKRRVAKSLRDANDDERGLAETADMSEDTDNIIDKINKVVEQTINITTSLLNERSKLKRPTDIINTPDFNFSNLEKFITDFNKIDINKMNADNIQKLTDAKTELEAFTETLSNNISSFEAEVDALGRGRRGRPRTGDPPPPPTAISQARQRELDTFFLFYNSLLSQFKSVIDQMNLKLLNYRQTTAVLKESGIEMLGGCMCCDEFQYRPQYQNRMYY
jgi:hypothetical protein